MKIFHEEFSTGQILKAADVSNAALQTWIRRGLIVGQKDTGIDMPGQPGKRRAFTYFNAVEIATAAALVAGGCDLRDAFQAGAHFAHAGTNGRIPGLPFKDGLTVLCVAGDRSADLRWAKGVDIYVSARHALGQPLSITMLDMNELIDRVCVALGHHPQKVIDQAYNQAAE